MSKEARLVSVAFQPFSSSNVRWETWEKQLELEILALDLRSDAKKAGLLLRCLGGENLEKVLDWVKPQDPMKMSFEDLLVLLRQKFGKKMCKTSARLKLLHEQQQPGESVKDYVSRMTQLFGQADLSNMTPEDFGVLLVMRGISDEETRQYMWNPDRKISSVDKLCEIATTFELSRKVASEVKASIVSRETPLTLNILGKDGNPCRNCGRQHSRDNCAAKKIVCWDCDQTGHFAKFCPKRNRRVHALNPREGEYDSGASSSGEDSKPCRGKLNGVNAFKQFDHSLLTVSSGQDDDEKVPPIMSQVEVNGVPLNFIYDTGASVSVVSKQVWTKLGRPQLYKLSGPIKSYNGNIRVLGKCFINVRMKGYRTKLWLTVVDKGPSLLGRNWMSDLGGIGLSNSTRIKGFDLGTSKHHGTPCFEVGKVSQI